MTNAMQRAYYNDNDPYCCAWLRNLIAAGHIAPGDVDGRSIAEVQPDELRGYTQVHFFAGIGGWSYALRLAGWPDERPVWTGSCPCQPFSVAGSGRGEADERHLWPEFRRLISECRPPVVLGEQVAGAAGRRWLAGVRADLEAMGFAVGAADLCAASCGAPHIRQRAFWLADASTRGLRIDGGASRRSGHPDERGAADGGVAYAQRAERGTIKPAHVGNRRDAGRDETAGGTRARREADDGANLGLADADGRQPRNRQLQPCGEFGLQPQGDGDSRRLGDPTSPRPQARQVHASGQGEARRASPWEVSERAGRRRIEPGLVPLAHGIPNRMGRLRGYGNAIVPQVAAEFVSAHLDMDRAA